MNTEALLKELVSSDSRYYRDANIINQDGDLMYDVPYFPRVESSVNDQFITITSKYRNRYDLVSYEQYSASKYWWTITFVNRILDPFHLEIDETIKIPSINDLIMSEVIG